MSATKVFLTVEPMDRVLHPAHVTRDDGWAIIVAEPTVPVYEVLSWALWSLNDRERRAIRALYGMPLSRPMMFVRVPKSLMMPLQMLVKGDGLEAGDAAA